MHCYICNFFVLLTHECFRKNCFFVFVFFHNTIKVNVGCKFPLEDIQKCLFILDRALESDKSNNTPEVLGF